MDGAIGRRLWMSKEEKEEKKEEEEMNLDLDIVCLTDTCGKVEGRKEGILLVRFSYR